MMIRKYLKCVIITICLPVIGFSQEVKEDYPLLWRIDKDDIDHSSYLYGTMHVRDERAFDFPDSVFLAMEKCDVVALEVHPDTLIRVMVEYYLEKDTIDYFKKILDETEYEQFNKEFKDDYGVEYEDLDNKNPLTIIDDEDEYMGNSDRQTFVDMYLYGVAQTLGKEISGLEPVSNQLQYLKENVVNKFRYRESRDTAYDRRMMDEFIGAYSKGDLSEIKERFSFWELANPIMTKRNTDMVNSIIKINESKSIFSAVGAAHLIGDVSVIKLLENQGYTVSPVKNVFTGIADQFEIDSNKLWRVHNLRDLGLQVQFPSEYQYFENETPIVTDLGIDTISVKIYLQSDLTNMMNYMVASNDMPMGYYLANQSEVLSEAIKELTNSDAELLSTDTISYQGYKGVDLRMKFKGQFYGTLRMLFRGNRTFRLLVQSLTANDKNYDSSKFFESVNFLPVKIGEVKDLQIDKINYPIVGKYKSVVDTLNMTGGFIGRGQLVHSVDPYSSALYSTALYPIKDYFWINNLDTFFNDYKHEMLEWNDTLINYIYSNQLNQHNSNVLVKGKSEDVFKRYQYSIEENNFILKTIVGDSIALYGDVAEAYLSHLEVGSKKIDQELLVDKSEEVLKHVYHSDSTIAANAEDALNYCVFDSTHYLNLEKTLINNFERDTIEAGVSNSILNLLVARDNYDADTLLNTILNNSDYNPYLKCNAMYELLAREDTLVVAETLINSLPDELFFIYSIITPFSNNLSRAYKYRGDLSSFIDRADMRGSLINIFADMAKSKNEQYSNFAIDSFDYIIRHYAEDLDSIKKSQDYNETSRLYSYLNLFKSINSEDSYNLIDELDTTDISQYMHTAIYLAKINKGISLEDSIMINLISSDDNYDVLSTIYQSNQTDLLPDSLSDISSVYQSKMMQFLYYDDFYIDSIEVVGEYTKSDTSVVVYSFNYSGEDSPDSRFIGVVSKTEENNFQDSDIKSYYWYIEEYDPELWKRYVDDNWAEFQLYSY